MWKKIGLPVLYILIGFVLGYLLSSAHYGYTMATGMFMFQEKEIFEAEDAAVRAYHNQPSEVAVWALENNWDTWNRLKE